MIIDDNMHWLPSDLFTDKSMLESWINIVPRAYGEYAYVKTLPGTNDLQIVIERPKGYENLNFGQNVVDPDGKIAAMNAARVDRSILRIPCWQEWLNLEMCKKVNDDMAKFIKQHRDRFLGLATVPPWGDKGSLRELERCIKELGFVGVEMAAHYGELYLDAEEFKPHFQKISQLGVPVCVHHTPLPVQYHDLIDHPNLRRLFGRCVAQATAVGRELFSGMFAELPDLKLIHTMLGGGFFAFADILAPRRSGVKEELERFDPAASEKIRGYLDRNIFFDISHAPVWGKAQIECAVKVHGADHLLFGSSYPVRNEWLLKGVEYIQSLDIGEKEKSLILGENAMRLFNIK